MTLQTCSLFNLQHFQLHSTPSYPTLLHQALYENRGQGKPLLSATVNMMQKLGVNIDKPSPCGAYLFEFFKNNEPTYVIVDDRLPINGEELAFSKCTSPSEMWVALLEKAYAKINRSYEAIESGKVQSALSDLTNGISLELNLASEQPGGTEKVWTAMIDAYRTGCLLAVGSNTGTDTDLRDGIALGHAYAVVTVFAGDGQRLVQLQNPWGQNSAEWTGDWSDGSRQWTRKWQNRLKQRNAADGKFWMTFRDFLNYFRNLYICTPQSDPIRLRCAWHGESACGIKTPLRNPHFILSTDRTTRVLVELRQDAPKPRTKLAYIGFYVLENGEKRVRHLTRNTLVDFVKPRNDRAVSKEIWLQKGVKYTLLCTTSKPVETGFTVALLRMDGVNAKLKPFKDNWGTRAMKINSARGSQRVLQRLN
jgi:hypothetical protein